MSHFSPKNLLRAAPAFVLLTLAAAPSRADRIEYIDGRVMEGQIVREDAEFVVIQDGTADFKIPRSLISRIIQGTPADKWLRSAKARLSAGDAEGAIQDLAGAVRDGVAPESLAAVMVRFDREIAAVVPVLPVPRREELRSSLACITAAELPRQGTLLLSRLRFHMALGDLPEAEALIEQLRTAHPEIYEVQREELADAFETRVDAHLEAARYDEAIDNLVLLRRLDPDRAGDKRVLLVLQWARRERDQGQFERAIDIYVNQLLQQSPEIARNRIVDALEQAEYLDRESDNLGRTIVLYERYGLEHAPTLARRKLVELWNEVGFKHLNAGRFADAEKAFRRVDDLNPGASRDGFLLLEHEERLAGIAGDDPLALYELGEWCMANGLLIQAKQAFLDASETRALRTSAQAQLKFIDNTLNEQELTRLVSLYEQGNYLEVLNGVHTFKGRPLSKGFRQQAEQLEDLTQEAIRLTVAERPQRAEVLWQQAERAYYTRDYATAQSLLRALIERYPDTPAGLRGEEFYRQIRPTLSLHQIEANPRDRPRHTGVREDVDGDSPLAREIRRLRGTAASEIPASASAAPTPAPEDGPASSPDILDQASGAPANDPQAESAPPDGAGDGGAPLDDSGGASDADAPPPAHAG